MGPIKPYPILRIGGRRHVRQYRRCPAALALGWGTRGVIVYVFLGIILKGIVEPGDYHH